MAPLSLRALLSRFAQPAWPLIAGLLVLTLAANVLVIVQPMILAGLLAAILGAPPGVPGDGALLDLNHLGARFLHLLAPWATRPQELLFVLGALYVAVSAAAAVVDYGAYLVALRIRISVTTRLQVELLRHLLSLDLRFFHRQKSGELMSRLTQDAVSTAVGVGPLVRGLLHHGIQLGAYSLYLFSTSLSLTSAALALVGLHFAFSQLLKKPMRRRSRELYDGQADFSTAVQETLLGIRVAKSFGVEAFELRKLEAAIRHTARAVWRQGRVEKLEAPGRAILDAVGIIGIFMIAASQLNAGLLTAQGLLLYIYVGRLVIAPANHLATAYVWIQTLLASYERIAGLLAETPRVRDGHRVKETFERALELRGVSFSYGSRRAIDGVSLEVPRGQMVALVGPSGAGKSTLADLVLRLYDPDSGVVLIDGVDVRDLRQREYRRLFGVVSQEPLLFHDTVANNIRYGRSDVSAEQIRAAAEFAHAHDFIVALPEGYDTLVGDRGVKLSGGERQRVAIARAVVHRPEILVFDEATSALDSDSERQVQAAMEQITRHTTALVIAHRLSTVIRADRIMVIDHGRVVGAGRHDDLLEQCELYRQLCRLQFATVPS